MNAATKWRSAAGDRTQRAPLVIGLVNNMPDGALQATERQFEGLLGEAAGGARRQRPLPLAARDRARRARARTHARPLRTASTGCPPPGSTA